MTHQLEIKLASRWLHFRREVTLCTASVVDQTTLLVCFLPWKLEIFFDDFFSDLRQFGQPNGGGQ